MKSLLISITFMLIATEFGGGLLLGTSDEAYACGIYGILYILGISLGFVLLGSGFAAKLKAMNVSSSIDIFTLKYHSPFLKNIGSILCILTLLGLLFAQIIACKTLLCSLGICHELILMGFWLLTCCYAITGGIAGAGLTHTFQLGYVLTSFTGIFFYCLFKEPPSFFALKTFIEHQHLFSSDALSFSSFFTSLIMPALYCVIEFDYAQPLFAARSKRMALISALWASLFMLVFSLVPLYFGIKAKLLNLTIPEGINPLIPVLHVLTNHSVVMIAICGLVAALIATTDYLLWAVTMSLGEWLSHPNMAPERKKNQEKIIAYSVGIGILAAAYFNRWTSVAILGCSFELYDCCLVAPLVMTYFKQEVYKGAAIGSMLAGLTGFIVFRCIEPPFQKEIASLLLAFAGYYLGELIEWAWQKRSLLKRAFALPRVG